MTSIEDNEDEELGRPAHPENLTIRATNGATWVTDDFGPRSDVEHVETKALKHFVREGQMQDGDYRIALVVDGVAQQPLPEDAKLKDVGVHEGSILVLVPRGGQVDG